jgi:AraC-like DNA-binding protein/mannose-6-phosphate isomerase-like protein (cupin superfamily)
MGHRRPIHYSPPRSQVDSWPLLEANRRLAQAQAQVGPIDLAEGEVAIDLAHLVPVEGPIRRADDHLHPDLEITWVVEGRFTWRVEGRRLELGPGDQFVMPPFQPHRWTCSGGKGLLFGLMLNVGGLDPDRLVQGAAARGWRLAADGWMDHLLELVRARLEPGRDPALVVAALRLIAVRVLLRLLESAPVPAGPATGDPSIRRVRLARALIRRHLAEALPIGVLARRLGVSARHLNRCFQTVCGQSVSVVQRQVRLDQACALLTHQDLSAAEVARCCGFANASHFGRIFRRHTGCSPQTYRRQAGLP